MKASNLFLLAALASTAAAAPVYASECGSVTIANMNWQSAELLANLDKIVLSTGYGCDTDIINGDTVPTITSMVEKNSPDIAPEGWVNVVPEMVARGLAEGRLVATTDSLSDGGVNGWWIPKYIVDAHPDIKTIDDVIRHPELFPHPEDAKSAAIFNSPPGWGAAAITQQFYKAYGAEKAGFKLVDTGSAAGLDGSITKAFERKEGWVGYYWTPTALLGRYEMVKLEHGVPFDKAEWDRCNTNAECPDPHKNDWPVEKVQTLITSEFAKRAGEDVVSYLNKRSWSNSTVNAVMAWMTENQADGEEGAKHYLRENKDIWSNWVSPEAAEKIAAAL